MNSQDNPLKQIISIIIKSQKLSLKHLLKKQKNPQELLPCHNEEGKLGKDILNILLPLSVCNILNH